MPRPVLQASRPSQTMATIGPLSMSALVSILLFLLSCSLTCDETLKEWLVGEVGVVLLKVLLGWGDHLDGNHLVASLLEARDDVADEAAL